MRTTSVVIVILLGRVGWADAPKPKPSKLSAADHKKYAAALGKGRELQAKQQWAAAEAAFETCLTVEPDDATALGELGWTAYLAKDLAKAETMTRRSLANQAAPNVRGASLYNLGLIEEALGHSADAITAYSQSLTTRPNTVVRARLLKLDPSAAARFDVFAPRSLAGPFKSVEAFCKTTATSKLDELGDKLDCSCGDRVTAAGPTPATQAFEAIELFTRTCMQGDPTNRNGGFGLTELQLAVKRPTGWFVGPIDKHDFNRHCADELHFGGVTFERGVRAIVNYNFDGDCSGGINSLDWHAEAIVAVQTGASGTPSATPPILVKRTEHATSFESDPPTESTPTDVALELVWSKDGTTLAIKGKTKGLDHDTVASWLGNHTLVFP